MTSASRLLAATLLAAGALVTAPRAQEDDAARAILDLVLAAQPSPEALPEGSTFNYIWAENMLAWMAAEQCGYIPRSEAVERLRGLLRRVSGFETHHGFFFDSYDPATGRATTDKVYFQGWWLWALMLTRDAYPEAAPLAGDLLDAVDYDAAGMVNAEHTALAADVFADSGRVSFWYRVDGDPAGEFRLAPWVYTQLTGDPTPWLLDHEPSLIDVGGHDVLSLWHHFVFDAFYVHLALPEFGYFERSWRELLAGIREHQCETGMDFVATRMEPLEAWELDPDRWPNTEHRVAKPWIAWLANPAAPVMERAWSPGYGVTQYFDHWDFSWSPGLSEEALSLPVGASGEATEGVYEADFQLETLPQDVETPHPPVLTGVRVVAEATGCPIRVSVNGREAGAVLPGDHEVLLRPSEPIPLRAFNTLRVEASGEGTRRLMSGGHPFRPVRWRGASDETWQSVTAPALTVYVEGQRAARENPYAFLARCAAAHGFFVWQLAASNEAVRERAVAWVGSYSRESRFARIIHNVSSAEVEVTHHLDAAEQARQWLVQDLTSGEPLPVEATADTLHWHQAALQTVRLREQ